MKGPLPVLAALVLVGILGTASAQEVPPASTPAPAAEPAEPAAEPEPALPPASELPPPAIEGETPRALPPDAAQEPPATPAVPAVTEPGQELPPAPAPAVPEEAAEAPAPADSSPALVTFYYRKPAQGLLGMGLRDAKVFVDRREMAKLDPNTIVTFAFDPGKHSFYSSKPEDEFELELVGGRHYYLRVLVMKTMFGVSTQLVVACPEVGRSESAYVALRPAEKIKDRARLVSSAAATPVQAAAPAAEPSGESAIVVFYRPWRQGGELLNTSVFVDGVELADLDDRSYLKVRQPAGLHRFHGDEEKDEFELELTPGETAYMRIDMVMGMFKGHGRLALVDPIQGRAESQTKSMRLAKDIRVPEVVVQDEPVPAEIPPETTPTAPPSGPNATIRVYFPKPEYGPQDVTWVAFDVTVHVDGTKVAELDDRTYVDLSVPPGTHRFWVDKEQAAFELELEPGARWFFRVDVDGTYYPVCEEQGISETDTKRMKFTSKILVPGMVIRPGSRP